MTSRLFLTLLALLTGLAAQASPTQARNLATGKQEVGVVCGLAAEARQGAVHGAGRRADPAAGRHFELPQAARAYCALPQPAGTLIGIDRTRE